MTSRYLPSINILRDKDTDINYRITKNSTRVYQELVRAMDQGFRAFVIIGSYGTGKSAFLLSLVKHLQNKQSFFKESHKSLKAGDYNFLEIVGSYNSFEETLKNRLGVSSKPEIFSEISRLSKQTKNGLVIVADEFGKFLEYAADTNPREEMYFVQEIAEKVSEQGSNITLITTLHQPFENYWTQENSNRQDWEKVKGRFKEISFHEPVEQLLFIAADYLSDKKTAPTMESTDITDLMVDSSFLGLSQDTARFLAPKLAPIDLLSASLLTTAIQRYGQNERSLFNFLVTTDLSPDSVYLQEGLFHVGSLYDYLISHYFAFLTSKINPDYIKWMLLRETIDRVDNYFEANHRVYQTIVKLIGLLNILSPGSKKITKEFISKYIRIVFSEIEIDSYIEELERRKIIRFIQIHDRYVLFEGTDLDLELALKNLDSKISRVINSFSVISEFFQPKILPIRSNYIKKGTPRFFSVQLVENLISEVPKGEIDGIIYIVMNDDLTDDEIEKFSAENPNLNIYIHFKEYRKLKAFIRDLEKVKILLDEYHEDYVALRELNLYKDELILSINTLLTEEWLRSDNKNRIIFDGVVRKVQNKADFNRLLDDALDAKYSKAPVFYNELINREKLPGAITVARKAFFERLILNYKIADLDYTGNNYPPERAVYKSLLVDTGIHNVSGVNFFSAPKATDLALLWKECESFLSSTISGKKSIKELFELLSLAPWKLKRGFLDFWIPTFLFASKEMILIYHQDKFINDFSVNFIDLLIRVPQEINVKKIDSQKVQINLFKIYKSVAKNESDLTLSPTGIIEVIKPYLLINRKLSQFASTTLNLTNETIKLRSALASASDPEKLMFEDIPDIFLPRSKDYSQEELAQFEKRLKESIKELINFQNSVYKRFEDLIRDSFLLPEEEPEKYFGKLEKMLSSIPQTLLLTNQVQILKRVLRRGEKTSWLNSIAAGIVGKNLEVLTDTDYQTLMVEAKKIFNDFMTMIDITKVASNSQLDEFVKVSFHQPGKPKIDSIIKVKDSRIDEQSKIISEIKLSLGAIEDEETRKKILLKLLVEGWDE